MKRILFFALSLAIGLWACNSGSDVAADQYQINGKLSNGSGNERILLEYYTLTSLSVIDTAAVDASGNFNLNGPLSEKGLYRMRIDGANNGNQWIVVLEPGKSLEAELDAVDGKAYNFGKSSVNNQIKAFQDYLVDFNTEMTGINQQYMAAMQSGDGGTAAQLQSLLQQRSTEVNAAIRTNADTTKSDDFLRLYYVSYMLGNNLQQGDNADYVKNFLAEFQAAHPASPYVTTIQGQLDQIAKALAQQKLQEQLASQLAEGGEAPEIDLPTPDGGSMPLSSSRGKYVLLDFWASWCRPCRMENPTVVRLYNQYKDQGFTVYSVSLDKDRSRWVNAIEQDGLVWDYHVSDLLGWKSAAAATYGVSSIPRTFLLDPEGKIIAQNLRGAALEEQLAELFN